MLEHFADAEVAYRRGQIHRSGRPSRRTAGPSLIQRYRDARRLRRNPVRGASRYESDGPLTRRVEDYWLRAATHH
ncbi:MAG TPA: hypothetical protein VGL75_13880 [Acidothermaceae bacterium]|jgi:hypothetical protein